MGEGQSLPVRPPAPDERWKPAQPHASPARLAAAAVATLVFHAALLFGTDWLDQFRRTRLTAEQEVPVEVVEEPPAPEQPPEPEVTQAPEPAPPQPEEQPRQAQAPAPVPQPEAPPQPEQPPPAPQQVPVTRADATQPPAPSPAPLSQGEASGALEVPSPPAPAPAEEEARMIPLPSEQAVATAEFATAPPSFRSAALPGAPRETEDSYKSRVFGMLERAKRTPAAAEARGARGAAFLSFMLDRAGNLVTVTLLRSSGDRELDAEALATVRRAAPFPTPPVGVMLNFTPVIYFGENSSR